MTGGTGVLPAWASTLVVVAHPDDETFGLGAIVSHLARSGGSVHVLCFTHGENSTLNENGSRLRHQRALELRRASAELGVSTVELLDYADGGLAAVRADELAAHVRRVAAAERPDGLLVFDDTGVTGHPDHQAATMAAVLAASPSDLPVLAWTLPAAVAAEMRSATGQPFAGQSPGAIDLVLRVDRTAQRAAAMEHASQISPGAALWPRLNLLGDYEYLRWLRRPSAAPGLQGV